MMNEYMKRFVNHVKNLPVLVVAGIVAVALWFPVEYFHELGHVLVCVNNGFEYTVFNAGIDLVTDCSGSQSPRLLYLSLGGIFGVIISLIPLIFKKIREEDCF